MAKSTLPVIGKNVIETLTSGMYENPHFIYREYIQNSADQIDIAVEEGILKDRTDGRITISVNPENRSIIIEDNATGIQSGQIRRFLGDVANSEKDQNRRKGFRGIGRLGGLGYCEKLVFETSYSGESVKNTMTLNAKLLKEIIANRQDHRDAAKVISVITKVESSTELKDKHYFRVSLFNVSNDTILDENSVVEYLSMVAPVSFAPDFKFKNKIKKHFKSKNFSFDEYHTELNETPIYKAYKNYLLTSRENEKAEITSIGFFDVRNDNYDLLAIGWYGISKKINEVIDKSNPERGIRIRKSNITIGNEQTLFPRFKADRTNLRYIGEIHVVSDGFIPNARRDYFNDNKTLDEFQDSLDHIFRDFESKLPHKASNLHNRLKSIKLFREANEKYVELKPKFKTNTEQEQRLDEVITLLNTALDAGRKIDAIKQEGAKNSQIKDLFNSIVGDYDYIIKDEELDNLHSDRVIPPLEFSKVNKDQEVILNEVVVFLLESMGYRAANDLIQKLQEKYN